MDSGKGDQGHFGLHPWYWLVCTSAGCLQAVAEREGRRHSGGSGGDHRLHRYDSLSCYGF